MTTARPRSLASRLAALGVAALALALFAACAEDRPAPPETPADARYTVRAEVVRMPSSTDGEIQLRHESIPDFRDAQGETVGMMSMTMPFGVAGDVDLSGIDRGDRVDVRFEVRWDDLEMPLLVTSLVPLPGDTRLEFDPEPASEELPMEETADDEPAADDSLGDESPDDQSDDVTPR